MFYVYILKSVKSTSQTYVGVTENLKNRLSMHNLGESPHTSKYRPWKLVSYVALETKSMACEFEKYLKSGSGRVFVKRRLIS